MAFIAMFVGSTAILAQAGRIPTNFGSMKIVITYFTMQNKFTCTTAIAQSVSDGFGFPAEAPIFLSSQRPDRFWGPPSLLSNEYQGLFPHGERGGNSMLTTNPSNAKLKNCGAAYTSTIPYIFMVR
jgi:hypothetical protein